MDASYHGEDAREKTEVARQNAPSATTDSAWAFYGLLAFEKHLRQLGEVSRHAPRLVLGEQLGH